MQLNLLSPPATYTPSKSTLGDCGILQNTFGCVAQEEQRKHVPLFQLNNALGALNTPQSGPCGAEHLLLMYTGMTVRIIPQQREADFGDSCHCKVTIWVTAMCCTLPFRVVQELQLVENMAGRVLTNFVIFTGCFQVLVFRALRGLRPQCLKDHLSPHLST